MSFSKFVVSNVSNNFFTHIKGKRDAADFTRDVILDSEPILSNILKSNWYYTWHLSQVENLSKLFNSLNWKSSTNVRIFLSKLIAYVFAISFRKEVSQWAKNWKTMKNVLCCRKYFPRIRWWLTTYPYMAMIVGHSLSKEGIMTYIL